MIRIAAAIFFAIFVPARAWACSITVTTPIQVLVKRAVIIAEGVAVDGPEHRFEVTKRWKGAPAPHITLLGDVEPLSSCYEGPPQVGETYVLFVNCDRKVEREGFAQYECESWGKAVPATPEVLRYLREPQRLSRRELIAKLRGWQNGRIKNDEMGRWAADQSAIAEFDDWAARDGEETSLAFGVLQMIDTVLGGAINGERECVIQAFRAKLVPDLLALLAAREVSEEQIETLDAAFLAIEDGC